MSDFAQLGHKLRAAREAFAPNINGMGAYEGGQLPGAINAATRIRTARAAVNDLAGETLAEFLADTLTVRFGKVKASLILRDALAGVLQTEATRSGGQPFTGVWGMPAIGRRVTVSEALDEANAALASKGGA